MVRKKIVAPVIDFEDLIHEVREQKVIFDADLARIYGVSTKRLNEQVERTGRNLRPVHESIAEDIIDPPSPGPVPANRRLASNHESSGPALG
jgi:ORF6N domain